MVARRGLKEIFSHKCKNDYCYPLDDEGMDAIEIQG